MPSGRFLAVALCASMLAACGSPGASITFSAPAKFSDSKNILGMAQIWTTPNRKEILMLMKLPVNADSRKTAFNSPVMKNATIEKQAAIKICGNQPARSFEMLQRKEHQHIDALMTTTLGSTYMSMYGYPAGSKPDPQAESAIKNLCAK
ncbi:MAG: hypothetical protein ABR584_07430 [Candidatus Baltobacteraceae bacterium]